MPTLKKTSPVAGRRSPAGSALRLHKFLAQTTTLSRRAAEVAIASGEVRVNGKIITAMGVSVTPGKDVVEWRGQSVSGRVDLVYFAFYKPKQCIVTKSDPQGRRRIWDILSERRAGLNAVGRLDYDSEGLLLLTNDGNFANALSHPKHHVAKIYQVKVSGHPDDAAIARLLAGLREEGEILEAKSVRTLPGTDRNAWLEIALHSGKYRQVRRMCEMIGHSVLKLKRVAIGSVRLGELAPGKTRKLKPSELRALWSDIQRNAK